MRSFFMREMHSGYELEFLWRALSIVKRIVNFLRLNASAPHEEAPSNDGAFWTILASQTQRTIHFSREVQVLSIDEIGSNNVTRKLEGF